MFKINEFRSHFGKHNEFAKASKFEVIIAPPAAAPDLLPYASGLTFQCENAELPGYTINTVDNRIYGVPNPVASTASFADITLTFICAGDMWEKKFFDRWMDRIVPINNYNPKYKNEYSSPKIEINQYSEFLPEGTESPTAASQKAYSVSIFEAFPVAMAPLTLNWADDGILKLAVTFKYEYWVPGSGRTQGPPSSIQSVEARNTGSAAIPTIPVLPSIPAAVAPPPLPPFIGGGGAFGGGGASGRY